MQMGLSALVLAAIVIIVVAIATIYLRRLRLRRRWWNGTVSGRRQIRAAARAEAMRQSRSLPLSRQDRRRLARQIGKSVH